MPAPTTETTPLVFMVAAPMPLTDAAVWVLAATTAAFVNS